MEASKAFIRKVKCILPRNLEVLLDLLLYCALQPFTKCHVGGNQTKSRMCSEWLSTCIQMEKDSFIPCIYSYCFRMNSLYPSKLLLAFIFVLSLFSSCQSLSTSVSLHAVWGEDWVFIAAVDFQGLIWKSNLRPGTKETYISISTEIISHILMTLNIKPTYMIITSVWYKNERHWATLFIISIKKGN